MVQSKRIDQLITDENCAGCFACVNICKKDAISMAENHEGFVMPQVDSQACVNCGQCAAVCPALNNRALAHQQHPAAYAFRAADAIRQESSSGGLFTVLAALILAQGGHVCGAVYDEKFGVKLVAANNLNDVAAMRSSKYVQAHANLVYRDVKNILNQGKPVLFTGTPCQVAALRSYLGRGYANLFCVDILCHGVPSQNLLKKHLAEIANGRAIRSVNFRDKRYGWNCLNLRVEFTDGSIYEGNQHTDAYEKGFHPNLFLRKACADCKFCEFPRQGDLSMGDFWGYEKFLPNEIDHKGTSLVFVNSAKGEEIWQKLQAAKQWIEQVEWKEGEIKNRVGAKANCHPKRERFFALHSKNNFSKAVTFALEKRFDIGCVGAFSMGNFGSVMTYFALYSIMSDMGYSVLMINPPRSSKYLPVDIDSILEASTYTNYDLASNFRNKREMEVLNKYCDCFIVGSDQLFNGYLYRGFDKFVDLDWVQDNKIKVAYAASFGHENSGLRGEEISNMAYFVNKFDNFSVREIDGVNICKKELGMKVQHVLDPVFLCNVDNYIHMASLDKSENISGDFLFTYILDDNIDKQNIIKQIGKITNLDSICYLEWGKARKFENKSSLFKFNKQLNDLINCKFIFTDSFHGICFAIIFKKNFILIANRKRGYSRFKSLLTQLGLMNRMIHSYAEFEARREELLKPIDYDAVYAKLNPLIEKSRLWLKNALETKKVKPLSDHDIFMRHIRALEDRIGELSGKMNRMNSLFGTKYSGINNIWDYISQLAKDKNNLLILLAVKDTPGLALKDDLGAFLLSLGLKINLKNKHQRSYLAVIGAGKLLAEKISSANETVTLKMNLGEQKIELISSSYLVENVAKIVVNGVNYAVDRRGLNFVVIDKAGGKPLDSVAFDTHTTAMPAYR